MFENPSDVFLVDIWAINSRHVSLVASDTTMLRVAVLQLSESR